MAAQSANGTSNEDRNPADPVSAARQALLNFTKQQHAGRRERDRITVVPRDGMLPVTEQQRYLWFLYRLDPRSAGYNVPSPLRLRGPLDLARLRAALQQLVVRHESLRTRFGEERGVPYQRVEPTGEVPLTVVDVSGAGLDRAVELAGEEMREPFDLETGPLLRCWLARLDAEDHLLLLTAHHIVIDGWSLGILVEELAAGYAGKDLPELAVQPADYAVWQQDQLSAPAFRRQLDYWRSRLDGVPACELPSDRSRPASPTGAGATVTATLPADLLERAQSLASAERVSLLGVLTAAFYVVLQRYTGQDDLAVGSVFAGRTRYELESMVSFLANTLVLRTDLSGDPTGRELLARCNETVLDAFDNQDVPFGTIVEELRPDRLAGRNPLFQASFTLLTSDILDYSFGELAAEPLPVDLGASRFDLAFQVSTTPAGVAEVWVEYSTELFDEDRIRRLVGHFRTALESLTAAPELPVSRLAILPAEERAQLAAVNPAPVAFETDGMLLHELVTAHAARTPDAVAVRHTGTDGSVTELSYAELDARSNQLARLLQQEHGLGPEVIVAVLLERGPDHPLAQLAVLKAGGAWAPLDPAHPAGRIAQLLSDTATPVVLTTGNLAHLLPAGQPYLALDELDGRLTALPAGPPAGHARPENLAYLIYTSGSTGLPKGVLIPHRAIVNFTTAIGHQFAITPADRILAFANPSFDVSVFDTYAALAHGATSITAPTAVLHDPDQLSRLLRTRQVTIADLPPAVLGLLDPGELPDLRALFVGLEAFPAELVNRWRTPDREFHNGYGPTEATIACIDYPCPLTPLTAAPPIGHPMPNQQAHLLDPHGNPTPIGVAGQLHLAGTGLARGYHRQAALTAERFTPNPYGPPGSRLYATGDLAQQATDGTLRYLGRTDQQLKIRGLRIEPGEIEHTLTRHPAITAAAVLPDDAHQHLHAYVTAGAPIEDAALRAWLAEHLPHHLIPTTITALDALPLTPNGKLDRSRLPRPEATAQQRSHQAPVTDSQRRLAAIWQALLGLPEGSVGATDSFFTLGGSSLLAMRLLSRIRDGFEVSVELRQLFQHPVLADFAALIDDLTDQDDAEIDAQLDGLTEDEIDRLLAAGEEDT